MRGRGPSIKIPGTPLNQTCQVLGLYQNDAPRLYPIYSTLSDKNQFKSTHDKLMYRQYAVNREENLYFAIIKT